MFIKEKRDDRLFALNRKRLEFIARAGDSRPEHMLYAQLGGGFSGIGVDKEGAPVWVSGPGPFDGDGDYCMGRASDISVEPASIKPEGAGGLFGFGKKGGEGWRIRWLTESGERYLEIIPQITAIMDVPAKYDTVFKKGKELEFNPVWDMRPESRYVCGEIMKKWKALLGL